VITLGKEILMDTHGNDMPAWIPLGDEYDSLVEKANKAAVFFRESEKVEEVPQDEESLTKLKRVK